MQMPQLQIRQTPLTMEYHTRKPVQVIEQPKAELNLKQEPAMVELRQPHGSLAIDSTRARQSIGIRSVMEFSDTNASFGYEKLMEAIGNISSEGDRMMMIEHKGEVLADIAMEELIREPTPAVPPSQLDEGVDVSYQARPAEIQIERRGYSADPIRRPPILRYTPGKVEGEVVRWHSVDIQVSGLHIDRSI